VINFPPSSHDAGRVLNGSFHHGKAVHRRSDRPSSLLLPGDIGHHQNHDVQVQGVADIHCSDEMSNMWGVKGSSEKANSLAFSGARQDFKG
jgi:hypothetical protein